MSRRPASWRDPERRPAATAYGARMRLHWPGHGGARGAGPCNAGFDDRPATYDELRADGHMARRRTESFAAVVEETPGAVLELGSGTGTLLRRLAEGLPDRTFVGVEPLANYVEFANARALAAGSTNVRFEVGVGEALPAAVEPGSVDLVISVDALHHVTDVDRVVSEVARVAAPGARWRVMEPNRLHPYVLAYHVLTPGERTFPARDFVRRAARAGWRLTGRERLFTYPSGVASVPPWAARLERRLEWIPPVSGAVVLDLVKA